MSVPSIRNAFLLTTSGQPLSGYSFPFVGQKSQNYGQCAQQSVIELSMIKHNCSSPSHPMTCMALFLRTRIPGLSCDDQYESTGSSIPHFNLVLPFAVILISGDLTSDKHGCWKMFRDLRRLRQGGKGIPVCYLLGKFMCSRFLSSPVSPHSCATLNKLKSHNLSLLRMFPDFQAQHSRYPPGFQAKTTSAWRAIRRGLSPTCLAEP